MREDRRVDLYPAPTTPAVTAVMRANPRKDTSPEVRLRAELHRRGLRFRKDYRIDGDALKVHVDIGFPGKRVAVFVDGCFWHSCPTHGTSPRKNQDYWAPKLEKNRRRDGLVNMELRRLGWTVVRIWEHETIEDGAQRVLEAVRFGA